MEPNYDDVEVIEETIEEVQIKLARTRIKRTILIKEGLAGQTQEQYQTLLNQYNTCEKEGIIFLDMLYDALSQKLKHINIINTNRWQH